MERLRVAFVPAGVALGIAADWVSYGSGELDAAAADLAVGWILLGCGLVAWERRPTSRVGPLLAAAGSPGFREPCDGRPSTGRLRCR